MEHILMLIGIGCICFGLGFILRFVYAKIDSNSVEQVYERIINEAKIVADAKAKEIIMAGRDSAEKERKEVEQEIEEKKVEVQNTEKRLNQREERNTSVKRIKRDKKNKIGYDSTAFSGQSPIDCNIQQKNYYYKLFIYNN